MTDLPFVGQKFWGHQLNQAIEHRDLETLDEVHRQVDDPNSPIGRSLMGTIDSGLDAKVPGAVAQALAEDDTPAQAAAAAVTAELIEGQAGKHFGTVRDSLAPLAPPKGAVAADILTRFQPGHPFTHTGAGTASDDPEHIFGSQSIRLTTNGQGTYTHIQGNIPARDLTGKAFRIWMRADNPAEVNFIRIHLGTGSISHNYNVNATYVFSLIDTDWRPFTFTPNEMGGTTGSPDWSNIDFIRISVRDQGNQPINLWINSVEVLARDPRYPNGLVTIDFDDSEESVWTYAKPIMDTHGLRGGVYAIPQWLGNPGFMTIEQLRSLQDYSGWDIMSHDTLTTPYPDIPPEDLEAHFVWLRQWMNDHRFYAGRFLSYPGGYHNATVRRIAAQYFTAARTTESQPGQEYPASLPTRIGGAMTIHPGRSLQSVIDAIETARQYGLARHLVFHRLIDDDNTSDSVAWPVSRFAALMDYLASADIPVVTMSEAY